MVRHRERNHMSDDIRTIGSHRSRRGVAWLALVVLLAACTGPSDPQGSPEASDSERAPVVQPTGAGDSRDTTDGASDGLDPRYRYPDPLSDNEVVNGRRVEAGAFPAIWPETSRADLALTQLATLHGREQWRLSPKETAERFAVEVLGWTPDGPGATSAARSDHRSIPGGRCARSRCGAWECRRELP